MFSKLKEKLRNWTKKISEKKEIKEIPEKEVITKESKKPGREIQIPTKFKPGTQKFEPDLEKLQEKIKKTKEQEKKEPEKQGFFAKIIPPFKLKISEKEFEIYKEELEMLLLENNVALEVAEKIIQNLKDQIIGKEFLKKEVESEITDVFKEIIKEILIDPFDVVEKIKEKYYDQSKDPYVILFCGINGTGKTTTVAKIADYLKKNNISCVLSASDTFRAASIEQLKKHGDKLGIKVIANKYGSDPASVGFDAIKYAKKNFINCVLIDTAGRIHTSKNLLKEIEKISRICKPDLKIFVGEAITGNDAIEQVKTFDWELGIDGIILTKADTDEKGGTALSVGYVTKKPILYLGTGQEYKDIIVFNKNKFIKELGL
ncbi:MAG: signal recognition particle-docking protein FtsY [Nanoarchaeota archaeon]|nr:signal recognition particle-docking protein FtsY [Nanoarchaeota archaeon]MBU1028231.1 signal recognition particle-docking protein FtsY [Nanoarchaeota archaeon]